MGAHDQGVDVSAGRWAVIPRTLTFILNGNDILLMKRAAHKRVFPGRYNGIGGHLERGEDVLSGALREVVEETGLTIHSIQSMRLCGTVHIDSGQTQGILLFVFSAESISREVSDCDEGALHWVPLARVNDLPLVDDVPMLLARLFPVDGADALPAPFYAVVHYDEADQMHMVFADPA